jgi:hypothetical protein
MEMLKITGIYKSDGLLVLEKGKTLHWKAFTDEKLPELPLMSKIILTLSFEENDLLIGNEGIVWATYDLRQAEIIQSTLLAQQINSEIIKTTFSDTQLFLIKIINKTDTNDAIDFIWQSESGLRLKPDWEYSKGEINKSFEQWLSGQ